MAHKKLIKWAGSKHGLVPELRKRLPKRWNDYHEPFCGSAALYFDLWESKAFEIRDAFLSDANGELIKTLIAVRDAPNDVSRALEKKEAEYLSTKLRTEYFNAYRFEGREIVVSGSDVAVATWFLFMNRTCWNGLYRVNRKGEFNVPHGDWKNDPLICDGEMIWGTSRRLENAGLKCLGFEAAAAAAQPGDLVYFDPPYLPVSKTSDFTAYDKVPFGIREHERLCELAICLAEKGVSVLLSNSVAEPIVEMYNRVPFRVDRVSAKRSINSDPEKRGEVGELIIRTYECE